VSWQCGTISLQRQGLFLPDPPCWRHCRIGTRPVVRPPPCSFARCTIKGNPALRRKTAIRSIRRPSETSLWRTFSWFFTPLEGVHQPKVPGGGLLLRRWKTERETQGGICYRELPDTGGGHAAPSEVWGKGTGWLPAGNQSVPWSRPGKPVLSPRAKCNGAPGASRIFK
jgi:hypothetical protein